MLLPHSSTLFFLSPLSVFSLRILTSSAKRKMGEKELHCWRLAGKNHTIKGKSREKREDKHAAMENILFCPTVSLKLMYLRPLLFALSALREIREDIAAILDSDSNKYTH